MSRCQTRSGVNIARHTLRFGIMPGSGGPNHATTHPEDAKQGVEMAQILISGFRCERCEHEWVPKGQKLSLPRVCPRCKNPNWNKPRAERPKIAA